jgi:hypothetical protein
LEKYISPKKGKSERQREREGEEGWIEKAPSHRPSDARFHLFIQPQHAATFSAKGKDTRAKCRRCRLNTKNHATEAFLDGETAVLKMREMKRRE